MTYVNPNLDLLTTPVEMSSNLSTQALLALKQNRYATIDVTVDASAKAVFCHMRPEGRPSFTPELLGDIARMQRDICIATADAEPFRYFVLASRIQGSYNLGGDLDLFMKKIKAGSREALRTYAYACIDAIYNTASGYHGKLTSVALVQGAALGGGFEAALACHHIVAERSATFGLPEVLFNLFPGMGAYSFLSRRLDAARAEKLILGGKIHTAAELYEMGIVDHLAEDGEGEAALRTYLSRIDRRHNAHRAVLQARQRINPITREELVDVVDLWVDAAMRLEESDLKTMSRLVRAQTKRHANEAEVDSRMAAD